MTTDVERGPLPETARGAPSTRSAVVAGVVTLVVVAVMLNLGFWQLRRHAEVADQNERIAARSTLAMPFETVDVEDPAAFDFQRVTTSGTWAADEEVLWRGRSRNTVTGYELLTPLVLQDGRVLLVDRGWVPDVFDTPPVAEAAPPSGVVEVEGILRRSVPQPGFGPQDPDDGRVLLVDRGWVPDVFDTPPVAEAAPPSGVVEVEGILRRSVPQPGFGPQDPDDGRLERVFHADLPRIAQQVSGDLVTTYYLRLEQAVPAASDEVLRPLAPIEQDAGPHLGYALQWFGFSASAVAAYLAWLWSRVIRPRRDGAEA